MDGALGAAVVSSVAGLILSASSLPPNSADPGDPVVIDQPSASAPAVPTVRKLLSSSRGVIQLPREADVVEPCFLVEGEASGLADVAPGDTLLVRVSRADANPRAYFYRPVSDWQGQDAWRAELNIKAVYERYELQLIVVRTADIQPLSGNPYGFQPEALKVLDTITVSTIGGEQGC